MRDAAHRRQVVGERRVGDAVEPLRELLVLAVVDRDDDQTRSFRVEGRLQRRLQVPAVV